MEDLSLLPFAVQRRIADCKTLYLAYQGRHHDDIQREMRELGHATFNRRVLYARNQHGKHYQGWPERFGWNDELRRISKQRSESGNIRPLTADNADNADKKSEIRSSGSTSVLSSDLSSDPRHPRHLRSFSSEDLQPLTTANADDADKKSEIRSSESTSVLSSDLSSDRRHPRHLRSCPSQDVQPSSTERSKGEKPGFKAWLKNISPEMNWDWKYQQHIIRKLKGVFEGKIKRLMIFVPPRHGKSELVTVRFSAWCLRQCPKMNIIVGSYNQKLANRFSRKIRNIYNRDIELAVEAENRGEDKGNDGVLPVKHDAATCAKCLEYASKAPPHKCEHTAETQRRGGDTEKSSSQRLCDSAVNHRTRRINTDSEWETNEGGGIRAVGAGAGITGFGGDLIIIDDPVKSRAEAESQTIRDNVYDWFNDDLYTRLEPNGAVILIQTRWHEDDLAGRLLREMTEDPDAEPWEVISFPAFAEVVQSAGFSPSVVQSAGFSPYRGSGSMNCHALQSVVRDPKMPRGGREAADSSPDMSPAHAGSGDINEHSIHALKSVAIESGRAARYGGGAREEQAEKVQSAGFSPYAREVQAENVQSAGFSPYPHEVQAKACTLNEDLRDELGRLPGEPLCPERFPTERLLQLKRRLGTYSFSALYQQRPTPAEGGFFKRHWFKIVNHAPPGLKWKRGYDLGINAKPGSDYTATARVARDRDGNLYIDRVLRRRMEYPEQRRAILGLIRNERDTEHFIEASANGNAVIQDLRRERSILGHKFRGIKVTESKTARAFTWNALAEEGRVHLVRGAWNTEFIEEACSFPSGPHDDQIDAVSIAVRMLVRHGGSFYAF